MSQTITEVAEVKAEVRRRDGRCVECGTTEEEYQRVAGKSLDVHRLEPGSSYTIEGCVTLCPRCHKKKPKSRHGSQKRYVYISPDSYRKLKVIASLLGLTAISADRIIEVLIDAEFARAFSLLNHVRRLEEGLEIRRRHVFGRGKKEGDKNV